MKPRTALQRQVCRMTTPPISQRVLSWAFKTQLDHYAYRYPGSKKVCCMDCGHEWEEEDAQSTVLTCPHCKAKLQQVETRQRRNKQSAYFSVISVKEGLQVIRGVKLDAVSRKKEPVSIRHCEICRLYLNGRGQEATVGLRRTMGIYADSFSLTGGMQLRSGNEVYEFVVDHPSYPKETIIPELRRNGYDGNTYQFPKFEFFRKLLRDPRIETLLKSGEPEHLRYFLGHDDSLNRCWASYKVARRTGYRLRGNELDIWCDYIKMLRADGKDIRNPYYICPPDVTAAHDRMVAEAERKRAEARQAKDNETVLKAEPSYRRSKARYFGLEFGDGLIKVTMLDSVDKIRQEGEAMHHCVFAAGYYKVPGSLILSATIDGKRIETVEYSIKDYKVLQSRGHCNANTEYHDRIIQLVESHKADFKMRQSTKNTRQ